MPRRVIDNILAVVVISSGIIRLECDGCWNQFSSPAEAPNETLTPVGREDLRPATQIEIAATGWHWFGL
jgi:hypothetical protein